MLVSPPNLKVVTIIDSVITSTLGSKYIIKPYRKYYSRLINRLGI